MTTLQRNLVFNVDSDASFRSTGAAWRQALLDAGAVATLDTGQINWATVVRSGTFTNQEIGGPVVGYEMYRFSDTLQGTRPVFIKIEYATQNQGNSIPWMWNPVISVGSGTNGAGVLTGVVSTRRAIMGVASSASGGTTHAYPQLLRCYFCMDGSTFSFAIGIDAIPTNNPSGYFHSIPASVVIERTRDLSGVVNGNGVVYAAAVAGGVYTSGSVQLRSIYQMLNFASGAVGASDAAMPVSFPGSAFATGVVDQAVTTYSIPVALPTPQGHLLGFLGIYNTDVSCGTLIQVSVFGQMRTYLALTQVGGTGTSSRSHFGSLWGNSVALLMRYE